MRFELLNACSIGLRSGDIGKVTQSGTGRFNHLSHTGNFVHREAIHHHDVAALEGGSKTSFEIGHERCCIHGSIQHEGRDHSTTAQAGDEGDGLPMPVRNMIDQPNAARAAAARPHHGGVGRGLVDEHQTGRVKHALFSHPAPPGAGHVRALLLRRVQSFF